MTEIKVPGKLYISGEYAILEPNRKALIMAVDKFIKFNITPSEHFGKLKTFSGFETKWIRKSKITFDIYDKRLNLLKSAIEVTESFLVDKGYKPQYFDMDIITELERAGKKYGFGSSAAVLVGTVKAILKLYGYNLDKTGIFKLAAISSILVNPKGSCGDIAASAYGGIIEFTSFSRKEILERLKSEKISDLVESDWNYLNISEIEVNSIINFIIVWSKSVALTDQLINKEQVKSFSYEDFLVCSDETVEAIRKSYNREDIETLISYIRNNRKNLKSFAKSRDIILETEELKRFCDLIENYGGGAKTSGAGGGDCAIGVVKNFSNSLKYEIIKTGVEILDVKIWRENE